MERLWKISLVSLGLVSCICAQGCADSKEPQLQADSSDSGDFLYLFLHPGVEKNLSTFAPQLKLATKAGVTKYTFYNSAFPYTDHPSAQEWEKSDSLLKLFTGENDKLQIFPRIALINNVGDAGLSSEHAMAWKDGTSNLLCWSTPEVQDAAEKSLRSIIQHYENSAFGPRIWGYQISALGTGEWIPHQYRERGLDYSPPNVAAFRTWLAQKYSSDKEFQTAWGNDSIKRTEAEIPVDRDHRFPITAPVTNSPIQAFYDLPRERDWVDYSEFVSDDTATTICRLAKVGKEACGGGKKIITFYGYIFELPGSMCGHLKAEKVLRDPNVDMMAAPISYQPYSQRLVAGVGGPMSAVDSMPLHQKTWVNEDDLHTHAEAKEAFVPKWYWDSQNPEFSVPKDLAETQGILSRNLAFASFHHAATWWMDLYGGGWYSDPGLWDLWKGELGSQLRDVRAGSLPLSPEVAVIVDEQSRLYEKFTWTSRELYSGLRNAVMGSGASVGFYYLNDYLDGKVPQTSATVFVNLWHVDDRKELLKARIEERGGVVIWQYAPAFVDKNAEGVTELTGISVTADQGHVGSDAADVLGGGRFGGRYSLVPRIVIQDPEAVTLGRYYRDKLVSAALKKRGKITHVLVADYGWNANFVHSLFQYAGVPLVTDAPSVVYTSKDAVFVYATGNQPMRIKPPQGTQFEGGETEKEVSLKRNEYQFLLLNSK
ncbi:MAG: hypothetical protein ACFUZC_03965 [Chthoniobacteraceae bacterium]